MSASQHAGVKHFVFVSSIAVGYPDQTHYHYAQSKAAAEQIVLSSSVHSTVVRPTIVTGPNAPVTRGLRKLRRGRMLILFGRADVNVQPIARRDVVELLLEVITNPPTERLIEAGGSESLPLRRFLELLCSPDGKPLVPVTIPVHPVRTLLAMLEPSLGSFLPLTAGQLALFLNDSTAAPSSVSTARRSMQLNELVAECHS